MVASNWLRTYTPPIRVGLLLWIFAFSLFGRTVQGQPASPKTEKKGTPAAKADPKAEKKGEAPMEDPENPFPRRFPAPGLEGGVGWLNTGGEITLKDLKGKIVLLDFWTYCCINCMHVLPDLAYLEKKYPNEIVVIGVHSAKFDNEKDSDHIRQAILRYEIAHPVINDANMQVWRKFGVHAWPTLVLIDPEGNYCGYVSGEGNREVLEVVVNKLIAYHKQKGTLDQTPIDFALETRKQADTPLRYPGKLLVDQAGQRLIISDSNHNRIVITDLQGKTQEIIGSGMIGAKDGGYAEAQFDHPQGIDLVGNSLYVADTENHLIRAVDLEKKQVQTVAGTGSQARDRGLGGPALETAIASPWDLKAINGKIYIAMAGPHQIWVLDPGKKTVKVFAGSGREDILDGPLEDAAFAQPSGLATDGKSLFVVDSEGSAVRKMGLEPDSKVETVVGTFDLPQGRSLFEFGDIDGVGDEARLQHPLGLAYREGKLYVADSYNHKIKVVDLAQKSSKTFLGNGKTAPQDDPPQFHEPAGLAFGESVLYVADTNNHRIRVVDLATRRVSTLEISGLNPPAPPKATPETPTGTARELPVVELAAGKELTIEAALKLPEGYKLNPLAPVTIRVAPEGNSNLIAAEHLNVRVEAEVKDQVASARFPLGEAAGSGKYRVTVSWSFCRAGEGGLCKLKTASWLVPINITPQGTAKSVRIATE